MASVPVSGTEAVREMGTTLRRRKNVARDVCTQMSSLVSSLVAALKPRQTNSAIIHSHINIYAQNLLYSVCSFRDKSWFPLHAVKR